MRQPETFADAAYRAVRAGDLEALNSLLQTEAGKDINARSRFHSTTLCEAARYDRVEMVRVLLAAGADPCAATAWGEVPLMAVRSETVARLLLAAGAGADVDAVIQEGRASLVPRSTALIIAVRGGLSGVVAALLEAGADPNRKDAKGCNALGYAVMEGHPEIARQIAASEKTNIGLSEAALLGEQSTLRDLLARGADLHTDWLNEALWWAAVGQKDPAILTVLLDAGADPDFAHPLQQGMTPLMQAARRGNFACVETLIARGAEVGARSTNGGTALLASLCYGRSFDARIPDALLAAGADVNAVSEDGWTPLLQAVVVEGAVGYVPTLLRHGADVEATTRINHEGNLGGYTALQYAVLYSRTEVVRSLLAAGADPNAPGLRTGDGDPRPPLLLARWVALRGGKRAADRQEIIAMLLEAGATE